MKHSKFRTIQHYARRTYSRIMHELYGGQLYYTVERDAGDCVEVRLCMIYTSIYLGGVVTFHRAPKPVKGRSAMKAEARIRDHLSTAHACALLLQ